MLLGCYPHYCSRHNLVCIGHLVLRQSAADQLQLENLKYAVPPAPQHSVMLLTIAQPTFGTVEAQIDKPRLVLSVKESANIIAKIKKIVVKGFMVYLLNVQLLFSNNSSWCWTPCTSSCSSIPTNKLPEIRCARNFR